MSSRLNQPACFLGRNVCCIHALCSAPLGPGHNRASLRPPGLQLLFLSLPEALSEAYGKEEPGPSPGPPSGSEGAGPELHRQGVAWPSPSTEPLPAPLLFSIAQQPQSLLPSPLHPPYLPFSPVCLAPNWTLGIWRWTRPTHYSQEPSSFVEKSDMHTDIHNTGWYVAH